MGFLKTSATIVMFIFISSISCYSQAVEGNDYERSSMHIMMIKHLNQRYDDIIEDVFLKYPFPARFNNHDLGVKVVSFAELEGDQSSNILSFSSKVNLGQKMVAKWFNRQKATGSFDMKLVKERGFYNANQNEINEARASLRGLSLLEDAGENLIHNTYLLVNDISYRSKGSGNWLLKAIGSTYIGNADKMSKAMTSVGGFRVNVTSYLFRLVWNDSIANEFYTKYYTEDGKLDPNKVSAFVEEKSLFQMEYVGKIQSESEETHFTASKDPSALLVKVTSRAIDKNIALLQHQYADFRIKAPLINTNPLKADVGLKEDVRENSQFEVLERMMDENGKIYYERVGVIRPIKGKIKDNRYLAEEDTDTILDATEFEVVSGKNFVPGMLIREK